MKFNERLKKLRLESGQTLKFIAKELNLSISAYSNYEQGIREPSLETLAKICKVFDVSADYLLGLED